MPLDLKTYENARHAAVWFDRNACSKILISGSDHEAFLNNILSQNMLGMQPTEWRETTLLSATSHVLAYLYAVKLENSLLLIGSPGTSSKNRALLEKFLITEDVQIHDTADWNFVEVWGPQTESLIKKNTSRALTYKPEGHAGLRTLILVKNPAKKFNNELWGEADVREVLRIENGILEFGIDFDESHMLSETRLEKKAASETKGCYPGQEVVAKIATYKRLNRGFVKLIIDDEKFGAVAQSAEQNKIVDPKSGGEIGRLTSQAFSPFYKKTFGLGWLKRGFFEHPGQGVLIGHQSPIPATVELLKN